MIEVLFSISASMLSGLALLVLRHIVRKQDVQNNRSRLMDYKIDSLVDCTSEKYGNGDFKERFEIILNNKMKRDDFIYKEIS